MAIDTAAGTEVKHFKNYIGGEWVDAQSGDTFEVINPANEEVVATVPSGGRDDAQRAIAAAREAFDSGEWTSIEPDERKRILLSVIDGLMEAEDELATMETLEAGMTIRATSTVVIGYCINHWDYFARQSTRPMQQALEPVSYPTHSYNFVLREPVGVCAGIIPWNFPLVMAVWKLAPALAMGNTCILKPASNTPLTALRLAEILDQTDLPKGVVNVITGGGSTVGEELASHPDVDKVSFTGSTVVGRRIMQLASNTIKRTTLELGGKSPNIVFDDADMDLAVDGALWATFFHQGQVCESGTRLLLPESIHDEFVERLVARAKQIKLGDTLDYETDMGPLVSEAQRETVENYVRMGKEEGAKLVIGGKRPDGRRIRARLLVRADDLHRGRQLDDDRAGGDLRPRAVGHQVQGRRGRDSDRQRHDVRPGVGRLVTRPRSLPRDREGVARRHGLDQRLPPDQLRRARGAGTSSPVSGGSCPATDSTPTPRSSTSTGTSARRRSESCSACFSRKKKARSRRRLG